MHSCKFLKFEEKTLEMLQIAVQKKIYVMIALVIRNQIFFWKEGVFLFACKESLPNFCSIFQRVLAK